MDDTRSSTGERLRWLEAGHEELREDVAGLREEVRSASERIERSSHENAKSIEALRTLILSGRQTNWQTVLQGIAVAAILSGMIVAPLWSSLGYTKSRVDEMLPREVAAKIKEEEETQFRGVAKEIQTQIDQNKSENARQDVEVTELRKWKNEAISQIAKVQQRLDDHDIYLWPTFQQIVRDQDALQIEVGKLRGAQSSQH